MIFLSLNQSRQSLTLRIFICIIYFCILVLALDWVLGSLSDHFSNMSDSIYIESLYRDIFIRHYSLNGWLVSRAPFFFPDWFVYFTIRTLAGNYGSAWYFYLVFNLSVLILFFYCFIRLYSNKTKSEDLLFSICWASILLLLLKFTPKGFGPHTILLPVYHSGALINGLLILWFWNRSLINFIHLKYFILFSLYCALATLSDEWWIVWFGLPIGFSTVILIMFRNISWKNIFLVIAMGTGILLGELMVRLIALKQWLFFSQISVGSNTQNFVGQLQLFKQSIIELFISSPLLFFLFIACFALCFKVIFFSKQRKDNAFRALHLAILFSIIMPLFFIIPLKMWGNGDYRYLHHWIYLPWLVVGLHLYLLNNTRLLSNRLYYFVIGFPLFFIPVLLFSNDFSFPRISSLLTKAPYRIACIDEVARINHLKNGIAEYWLAKSITEQSHAGLLVNQFTYDYQVLHWMNNLHWYLDSHNNPINYDFIITEATSENLQKARTQFGTPTDINLCSNQLVLIYKDDKKKQLNDVIRPRVQWFFNHLTLLPLSGTNILKNGNFSSSTEGWKPSSPPAISVLQRFSFEKYINPTMKELSPFLRWFVTKKTQSGFLEQQLDLNTVQGKQLTLTFWARTLTGTKTFSSHAYLAPHGVLDTSAQYVGPTQNAQYTLDDQWRKFTIYYQMPPLDKNTCTPNNFAVIRPIFFDSSDVPIIIDLRDIQFLMLDAAPQITENANPITLEPKTIKMLLKEADDSHAVHQLDEEFKLLKKAEFNIQMYSSKKDPVFQKLRAAIEWRLARAYFNFSKNVTPEERTSFLYIAQENAERSYNYEKTSDSSIWNSILLFEMGKTIDLKRESFETDLSIGILRNGLKTDPSNPKLYALLGEINYKLADMSWVTKLRAYLLGSKMPSGSYNIAKYYFTQALQIQPNNIVYEYWLNKTLNKLHQSNAGEK